MSLHGQLVSELKSKGIKKGYTIRKNVFPIPDRKNIVVDVSWQKENETKVWEVELKARYEEKLFKFHLLKEHLENVSFGLVVQRDDSRKQVNHVEDGLFSEAEKKCLEIITINELLGKSIEELAKPIHNLFYVHKASPKMCVSLFSPCAFDDGFNRGLRLTGIYLKEQGHKLNEIQEYLIWLSEKLGMPEFETKSALEQIARESFPSCEAIRLEKIGRAPYILRLGDLNIQDVCRHCKAT